MVDPIGLRPVSAADTRNAPVVPVQPVRTVESVAKSESTGSELNATDLARQMASTAPVDEDRVARIRAAIQQGTFPILPTTIADRLLALKLQWSPRDDQA